MYFHALKKGLKTTYYLRSRPATRIAKATVRSPSDGSPRDNGVSILEPSPKPVNFQQICLLENPENCEACQ
jgi:ribonucleoside-diphosphate reductase alpha chain